VIETERRDPTPEERALLVKYVGWGAFPNVFETNPPREWRTPAAEVRELLTPEEYASARASTPNAHYTSTSVIAGVWSALEHFGLGPGAHIVEPSLGVGHFFGLMPERLYADAKRTGVELDSLSARIASKLYPDSSIHFKGFEELSAPNNFFDVAVGNIPFGNYPVFDPAYRQAPHLTRAIHDYFLTKCLDIVRPGGVLALITSRFSMDKQDSAVRQHLSEGAILVGAIRLPNSTFKANAGTDVTTDILFFQKRPGSPERRQEPWTNLAWLDTPDGPIEINEYFVRHPEMMLGQMVLERGQYGTPTPFLAGTLNVTDLANAISRLPARIYGAPPRHQPVTYQNESVAIDEVKDGALTDRDGQIHIRRGDKFEPLALSHTTSARIRGMIQVRDAVHTVFNLSSRPRSTRITSQGLAMI
jgi:hypothetical protein